MAEPRNLLEVSVKYKDGKKWKDRSAVLQKMSPVADCLHVCLYKLTNKQKILENTIPLTDFFGIDSNFELDKELYVLSVVCKNRILTFAFRTPEMRDIWQTTINQVMGKESKFTALLVKIQPALKLPDSPVNLFLYKESMCLATVGSNGLPPKYLLSWNIYDMVRYGVIDGKYCFDLKINKDNRGGCVVILAILDSRNSDLITRKLDELRTSKTLSSTSPTTSERINQLGNTSRWLLSLDSAEKNFKKSSGNDKLNYASIHFENGSSDEENDDEESSANCVDTNCFNRIGFNVDRTVSVDRIRSGIEQDSVSKSDVEYASILTGIKKPKNRKQFDKQQFIQSWKNQFEMESLMLSKDIPLNNKLLQRRRCKSDEDRNFNKRRYSYSDFISTYWKLMVGYKPSMHCWTNLSRSLSCLMCMKLDQDSGSKFPSPPCINISSDVLATRPSTGMKKCGSEFMPYSGHSSIHSGQEFVGCLSSLVRKQQNDVHNEIVSQPVLPKRQNEDPEGLPPRNNRLEKLTTAEGVEHLDIKFRSLSRKLNSDNKKLRHSKSVEIDLNKSKVLSEAKVKNNSMSEQTPHVATTDAEPTKRAGSNSNSDYYPMDGHVNREKTTLEKPIEHPSPVRYSALISHDMLDSPKLSPNKSSSTCTINCCSDGKADGKDGKGSGPTKQSKFSLFSFIRRNSSKYKSSSSIAGSVKDDRLKQVQSEANLTGMSLETKNNELTVHGQTNVHGQPKPFTVCPSIVELDEFKHKKAARDQSCSKSTISVAELTRQGTVDYDTPFSSSVSLDIKGKRRVPIVPPYHSRHSVQASNVQDDEPKSSKQSNKSKTLARSFSLGKTLSPCRSLLTGKDLRSMQSVSEDVTRTSGGIDSPVSQRNSVVDEIPRLTARSSESGTSRQLQTRRVVSGLPFSKHLSEPRMLNRWLASLDQSESNDLSHCEDQRSCSQAVTHQRPRTGKEYRCVDRCSTDVPSLFLSSSPSHTSPSSALSVFTFDASSISHGSSNGESPLSFTPTNYSNERHLSYARMSYGCNGSLVICDDVPDSNLPKLNYADIDFDMSSSSSPDCVEVAQRLKMQNSLDAKTIYAEIDPDKTAAACRAGRDHARNREAARFDRNDHQHSLGRPVSRKASMQIDKTGSSVDSKRACTLPLKEKRFSPA